MRYTVSFNRWASREGCVVRWGNVIGGYRGQEFTETFETEAQAEERVRQALAREPIGADLDPVAVSRVHGV